MEPSIKRAFTNDGHISVSVSGSAGTYVTPNKSTAGRWVHIKKRGKQRDDAEFKIPRAWPGYVTQFPRLIWAPSVCRCCGTKTDRVRVLSDYGRKRLEALRAKRVRKINGSIPTSGRK